MPTFLPTGRAEYAIPEGALTNPAKQKQLAAFFWWTSWAASTDRPGSTPRTPTTGRMKSWLATFPHGSGALEHSEFCGPAGRHWRAWCGGTASQEKDAGARAVSGAGSLSWGSSRRHRNEQQPSTFAVVVILWGVQILMGMLTAHYGVEGQWFFGFPLDKYLPYAVTRTWHLQLAIFWIATSWLATGLFVGPAVSGHEPKFQRLGVNALFGALVLVVGGSLAGEWMGIQQRLGNMWFWFGSQGYEYVDLGRFWQILLLVGLVLWLG